VVWDPVLTTGSGPRRVAPLAGLSVRDEIRKLAFDGSENRHGTCGDGDLADDVGVVREAEPVEEHLRTIACPN
jgi:hypothetical protein